jgi:hypothetical protein
MRAVEKRMRGAPRDTHQASGELTPLELSELQEVATP